MDINYINFVKENLDWYIENVTIPGTVDIYDGVYHNRSIARDKYKEIQQIDVEKACPTCGKKFTRNIRHKKIYCGSTCRYGAKRSTKKYRTREKTNIVTYSGLQEVLTELRKINAIEYLKNYTFQNKPIQKTNTKKIREILTLFSKDDTFDVIFVDGSFGKIPVKRTQFSEDYLAKAIKLGILNEGSSYDEIYKTKFPDAYAKCIKCGNDFLKYKYSQTEKRLIRNIMYDLCSYKCICDSRNELYPVSDETRQRQSNTTKSIIAKGLFTPINNAMRGRKQSTSEKYGEEVKFDSSWEKKFYEEYEYELKRSTPRIEYISPIDNKSHIYVVDFFDNRTKTMIEIKPSCHVSDEVIVAKTAAAKLWAEEHECTFKIITEKDYDFS